jgi:hypothetical protein
MMERVQASRMSDTDLDALEEMLALYPYYDSDRIAALAAIMALRAEVVTVLQREADSQKRHDDKLDAAEARAAQAEALLLQRDEFIVSIGQWEAFVALLAPPLPPTPEEAARKAALVTLGTALMDADARDRAEGQP